MMQQSEFSARPSRGPQAQPVPPPNPVPEDEIDLKALMLTLWRGKWWIAACAALAVAAGIYYAFVVATPVYTATATVALENRQEQVANLDSVLTGLSGDQATINTEIEVIRSRELAGRLVDAMDLLEDPEFNLSLVEAPEFSPRGALRTGFEQIGLLEPAPEFAPPTPRALREAVITELLAMVSVSNVRDSYVFRITAVTTDPQKSALIVNTLAEIYIRDQIEFKQQTTAEATDWLSARVAELKVDLEEAIARANRFEAETDLVSPEALIALNRQLKDLRERTEAAQAEVEAAEARLGKLQALGDDPVALGEASGDATLQRIAELAAGGEADLASAERRAMQVLERAELNLQRARGQLQTLRPSLQETGERINAQSADLRELQQLQREADASRLIYEHFLTRLKETSIQQGIQQADSRLLSAAVVPAVPSEPRKSRIVALAAILGLMVGAGGVLAREMLQNTFRSAEELEAETGRTVMGVIPRIPARRRARLLAYVVSKPNSHVSEAIRNLRTSLLLSNADNPPKVVISASAAPGDGKTIQAIMLAQNFAGLGKRVLLIEGDIRRRAFQDYFKVPHGRGLASVLAGEVPMEEVVHHDPRLKIDVLIGEQPKINAADLFSSESFAQLIQRCREEYDLVMIDTPPVLAVPDARVIGLQADAILYSVRWNSTPRGQVRAGISAFENVGLRVTGLVLTQVDFAQMQRYGYEGYGGAYTKYYR